MARKILLGVILLTGLYSVVYLLKIKSPNRNDAKLHELQRVYSQLPLVTGMRERNSSYHSKSDSALVEKYYDLDPDYNELRGFYLRELPKQGWRFTEETSVKDWGRDLGGRRLEFRNSQYTLVIRYAGARDDQWDCAVTLIWNNSPEGNAAKSTPENKERIADSRKHVNTFKHPGFKQDYTYDRLAIA